MKKTYKEIKRNNNIQRFKAWDYTIEDGDFNKDLTKLKEDDMLLKWCPNGTNWLLSQIIKKRYHKAEQLDVLTFDWGKQAKLNSLPSNRKMTGVII